MSEIMRDDGPGPPPPPPPVLEIRVKRNDPFLILCRCLSFLTAVSAILCVVVNVISAIRSFQNAHDIFDGILRCYAVLIALFVAIAETEWERILNLWQILAYCPGRGMLQIFVAVMTKSLSNGISEGGLEVIVNEAASYLLLSCGFIHIMAGLLCMGRLKQARLRKSMLQDEALREYQNLESRRSELESLLSARP